MEELKPCPFCGGEADIVTQKVTGDGVRVKDAYIECTECGIRGSTFRVETTKNINAWWLKTVWNQGEYKEMVRQWNRRVRIKEKGKPVWKPQKEEICGRRIEYAFCPRCGMMLGEMCVKGERMHEKYCKNCGVKIDWREEAP